MNKIKKHTLVSFVFFFCFVFSTSSEAYVRNLTNTDALVRWPDSVSLIDIYVNPANTQGFPEADVHSETAAAVAEWNGKSRISIRKNTTTATAQENVNEIYFSTDPSVFNGTGVIGVTQVLFKNNTGEILEADILLNDNYIFSTTNTDVSYLGNVITHEMGHFLGLGHSPVASSTMFYALTRGQYTLSADDKAGVYSIYPNGDTTKALLKGKIVGGNNVVPVFGAHVQAISLKTGEVAGATISDVDGSFAINGLPLNDQFYIYTSPIVKVGLPTKYNNARADFCENSQRYRGSFFQSCGSSFEGYPQAVKLNSSQVNVGNVTIRCGLDVPLDYLQNKSSTPATFDLIDGVTAGIGNAFVGYFSNQEMATPGIADYFKFDVSGVDWNTISPTGNLYVELKIINQSFFSPFKANIEITRNSGTTTVTPKYVQKSDGWLSLDTTTRILINRADPSDNNFEIKIAPESLVFPSFPTGIPFLKEDLLPSSSNFQDSLYFYLASASIVKDMGGGTYTLMSSKNDQLTDNTTCTDAINTYALSNYSVNGLVANARAKKKDSILGCGSVDMNGGSGSGPGGFFIGLIFSLLLCSLTSSIIKQYRSKQYSKMV